MSNLTEQFNKLTPDQHEQLMYAFEQGFEQVVKLDDGIIIGVHVVREDILILESNNDWVLGKLKEAV